MPLFPLILSLLSPHRALLSKKQQMCDRSWLDPWRHRVTRCLPGLRGFLGCGTFCARTGTVPGKWGWCVTLLLSDLSWSHLPLGLSISLCTLKVEGIRLDDCWETDSPRVLGFRVFLNMTRLVKRTFQAWSTDSSTAQKNFSLSVLQVLNSLFVQVVGVKGGKSPGEVMLTLWL